MTTLLCIGLVAGYAAFIWAVIGFSRAAAAARKDWGRK